MGPLEKYQTCLIHATAVAGVGNCIAVLRTPVQSKERSDVILIHASKIACHRKGLRWAYWWWSAPGREIKIIVQSSSHKLLSSNVYFVLGMQWCLWPRGTELFSSSPCQDSWCSNFCSSVLTSLAMNGDVRANGRLAGNVFLLTRTTKAS